MNRAILLGVTALALAAPAFAEEAAPASASTSAISYNYVEANYVNADIDDLPGSNPDGFAVNGAIAFNAFAHGYIDYNNLDYNGTTIQTVELGAGFRHGFSPTLDLVGRAAFVKALIEGAGNDQGLAAQLGLRARPADRFELEALVHWVDLDDAGDTTSLKAAARYYFLPAFSVGAGVEYDDDATVWNAGFRWTFK